MKTHPNNTQQETSCAAYEIHQQLYKVQVILSSKIRYR